MWNGEVLWFAEVYGTNGVSTEGLTLEPDVIDPTRAILQVSAQFIGDVVAYAQYPSETGASVSSEALRVASFEPSSPAVELRVLPQGESLPVGTTMPIEVFVRHENGLWLQRHVAHGEISVTSQSPSIVNVNNPLHWNCLSSGPARVTVAWRGLTNTAEVTVFGYREDNSPIPEPLVWLRADAGLSLTNGTNVISWTDQSRNNFVFTAPTVATQPTWVANSTSGVPAIRFNSSSTPRLQGNLGRTLTNATIFTLARYLNNANGDRYIYSFGTINYSGLMMTLAREGGADIYHYDGAAQRVAPNRVPGTGFRVFSQVFGEDGPDRHRLAVDGRTVIESRTTVGRAYSAVATNVVLGKYINATFGFTGDLVEWLVYDRVLSVEERFEVEEYLRQRASLAPFVAPGSFDLSSWEGVAYGSDVSSNAVWNLDLNNRMASLTNATDPAMLLSPVSISNQVVRAKLGSDGTSGFLGFVFGFENAGKFLLFDWNRATTNHPTLGLAPAGMRLRAFHVPGGNETTAADFWASADPTHVTTLATSETPWVPGKTYDITLSLLPNRTDFMVADGTNTLATWTLPQVAGVSGQAGFFAYQAAGARFGDFRLPGADPLLIGVSVEGEFVEITWINGEPPFIVEGTSDLASGLWYELSAATPNYRASIPIAETPLFLRVRGSDSTPSVD